MSNKGVAEKKARTKSRGQMGAREQGCTGQIQVQFSETRLQDRRRCQLKQDALGGNMGGDEG